MRGRIRCRKVPGEMFDVIWIDPMLSIMEGDLDEAVGIETGLGEGVEELHHLFKVPAEELSLVHLEEGEGDAEHDVVSLRQEDVPDAQHAVKRDLANEHHEEPAGGVGGGDHVVALKVGEQQGELGFDEGLEDLKVQEE